MQTKKKKKKRVKYRQGRKTDNILETSSFNRINKQHVFVFFPPCSAKKRLHHTDSSHIDRRSMHSADELRVM